MNRKIQARILLLSVVFLPIINRAQTLQITDPFNEMISNAGKNNPNFKEEMRKFNEEIASKGEALSLVYSKSSAPKLNTVPVVFHIVLNASQMTQMGGEAGIIERIKSQIDVLNQDFNGLNADSTGIPVPFKPLYANMGIQFALAKVDPSGKPTPGYEFLTTTKAAFDAQSGTAGTKKYCSDAKFKSSGGLDSWDPQKYINVWVLNITPTGIGGIGTPPPYDIYGGTNSFPWNEQGVALAYGTLGKKTSPNQYFLAPTVTLGRVLVHELGHFFNLFHPFGMSTNNNVNCTDDDGVSDTPPQVAPTQSVCPTFPKTDACSPNVPGVMFVNYMDYEAQSCALMFSLKQRERVYVEVDTPGFRHPLFIHPNIVTGVANATNENFVIYPNPASALFYIQFSNAIPSQIELIDQLGQTRESIKNTTGLREISINTTDYSKGLYIIRCTYSSGVLNKKIIIN